MVYVGSMGLFTKEWSIMIEIMSIRVTLTEFTIIDLKRLFLSPGLNKQYMFRFVIFWFLTPFPSNPTSKLYILGLDSNTLRMDSSKICILEQPYQVRFSSFLKCQDS